MRAPLAVLTTAVAGCLLIGVMAAPAAAALRGYRTGGASVKSATDRTSAPRLGPGSYRGTLGVAGRQYYAVDVPKGGTGYLAATAVYPRGQPGYPSLHVRLKGPDGTDCGLEADASAGHAGDGEPLTVAVAMPAQPAATGCTGSGRYTVQVWRNGVGSARVPLEVQVEKEPAIHGNGGGPAATLVPFSVPAGAPRRAAGGGSFATAGTLSGSGRYADTLQQGEFVFYRVHLGWDQGLAYRVTYAGTGRTILAVASTLSGPARQPAAAVRATYVGRAAALPVIATLPVRYGNRGSVNAGRRAQSQAGWYYLAVSVGRRQVTSGGLGAVPVRLDLSVVGAAGAGPDYRGSRSGPTPSPSPAPTTPSSGSAGGVAGSASPPSQPGAVAIEDTDASHHWLIGVWLGVLVGVGALAALLAFGAPPVPPQPRGRHLP